MPSTEPLIVFAGGGTGGHLFPAVAVFEHLRATYPAARCLFLCTDRPFDTVTLQRVGAPFRTQVVRPLRRQVRALPGFLSAWRHAVRACTGQFRSDRPAVVVGTGGYGSGPAVRAAARLGIPVALFNPDAVPGTANRLLARYASRIYVQWPETCSSFRRADRLRVAGCPVRQAFLTPRGPDALAHIGLDPLRRTLLITGASSGAQTLNDACVVLAPSLACHADWQVLHIAGSEAVGAVQRAYDGAGVRARVVGFLEDMASALHGADLIIGRAGAVTLAEVTAVGRPAILLPYPFHRDQHQTHNAEMLVRRGGAIRITDSRDAARTAAALRPVVERLLRNHDARATMAQQSHHPTAHDATRTIACDLLELSGCAPIGDMISQADSVERCTRIGR